MTIHEFGRQTVLQLMDRVVFEMNRTARTGDVDAIHDLRVAIRRSAQSLRVFREVVPAGEEKRMRKRMRQIMDAAAEVRDRDIAIELLEKTGTAVEKRLKQRLQKERSVARQQLMELLRSKAQSANRWHAALKGEST